MPLITVVFSHLCFLLDDLQCTVVSAVECSEPTKGVVLIARDTIFSAAVTLRPELALLARSTVLVNQQMH